jgi:hypothetical protein
VLFQPGRWLPALLLSALASSAFSAAIGQLETPDPSPGGRPDGTEPSPSQGLKISIEGEAEHYVSGLRRVVNGVFHNVRFDAAGGKVELVMYAGTGAPPAQKSRENFYHFIWNVSGSGHDLWWDPLWNYTCPKDSPAGCRRASPYLQPAKSQTSGGSITFYVGLDGLAQTGDWTVKGGVIGGVPAVDDRFRVEIFRLSVAKSEPSIVFEIPPFTASQNNSSLPVRIENDGNVPFFLRSSADCPGLKVTVTNTGMVHIGEPARQLWVAVAITPRAPARLVCQVDLIAELPTASQITGGAVTFNPAVNQPVDVTVVVARPGFEVADCGGGRVVLQYKERFVIKVAEQVTLQMFATGKVEARFYWEVVKPEYAEVSNVLVAGGAANQPVTLPLSEQPGGEIEILMTVRPRIDDVDIFLRFLVQEPGGQARRCFQTMIVVLAEPDIFSAVPTDPVTLSVIGLAIVLTTLIVIFAFVTSARRKAKRIEMLREARRRRKRAQSGVARVLSDEEVQARREELRQRRLQRRKDRRRRKWLEQHEKARERKGRRR